MAGLLIGAQTGEIAFTLATGTITLAQVVAAASHRVVIHAITVSFKGISATEVPLRIQIIRQTTAGTMSALTVQKLNVGDNETVQTTALHTSTAAPTDDVIYASAYVHPQRSMTFTGPWVIVGGDRLGVKILSPAQNGTCVVSFRGEE
jgi:hypothetical protein